MADAALNGHPQGQDIVMQDTLVPTNKRHRPTHPDPVPTDPLPQPTGSTTPARTSSQPPASIPLPEKPAAHGAPTRVYLNQNVTPHLLEGMKYLAAYEPEKPLKWLSEFLAKRSGEIEGA
ncbi:hypothetical protein KVT40_004682 [Elsinoe batatas]|uniref:COMPASS component SDC1 n=1 Tax=Elsinoe batatas TaxID=2601811 RepID=A0A8K0L036_9PEZI|nr:hypothetical protein KVT40_004682 [Elsinoe batatas]